jgi:hypothetical protein
MQDSQNHFFRLSPTSSLVWLIPLVNDPQTTWITKFQKRALSEGDTAIQDFTVLRPHGPPKTLLSSSLLLWCPSHLMLSQC